MATYPNTQLNLGQSSPDDRNDLYSGEGLYIFDREQTSFLALFDMARNFVLQKDDASNFRDFFAGSVGSTLIELAAGYSEFNSYASIVARRESYLPEARLLDSAIGIAQTLGYSTFRGQNPKVILTFIPTQDIVINKFDIVGSVGSYDVVSLEDKAIKYGEETDLLVVLGTLRIAAVSISDAKTYDFRFAQDKISEDIQLRLDGQIVPISNILYDLLTDHFVVLSNPVGGIDVRYLNKSQPEKWREFNRYTFLDYVLPTYDWRPNHVYYTGDVVSQVGTLDALPVLYVCTREGVSSAREPIWSEIIDEFTSDNNIRWKCIGRIDKQYFFRNVTPGISISGAYEPKWLSATQNESGNWKLNLLGTKVFDNDETYNSYEWRQNCTYSIGDIISKKRALDGAYILYSCIRAGLSNNKEQAWNETVNSEIIDGEVRWKCLGSIDVVSNYDWVSNRLYSKGDVVANVGSNSSLPFVYVCIQEGRSGSIEPDWIETVDRKIIDNVAIWKCVGRIDKFDFSGIQHLTWICTDTYEDSKYFYNTGSTLALLYIELENIAYEKNGIGLDIGTVTNVSVENEFKDIENLKEIKRNAPLYNETRYVIRGREDYRKIFQILLTNCVDTNGFDPIPAIVELTYVKDHTNHMWMPDTYYESGDEIMSTDGNGLIYRAGTSGYGSTSRKGFSGDTEPKWLQDVHIEIPDNTIENEGEIIPYIPPVQDNTLTWYPRYLGTKKRPEFPWEPNKEYGLHAEIPVTHMPQSNPNRPAIYFTLEEIKVEPIWPTVIGQSVQDNNITWTCIDNIYLDGYDYEYWKQEYTFQEGTFVVPVVETGYFYKCVKTGKSGVKEPNWPTVICDRIIDGGDDACEWECYDRTDAPKYVKNICAEQLAKYRQYGVSPAIITDPRLVVIDVQFHLVNRTNIDRVTMQHDLFKVIDKYQRRLNTWIDTKTLEETIEEDLDYIKIARATITGNNKTQEYQEGHLYRVKDVIRVPDSPYLYVAHRIETGGYGYTQWRDRSYSQIQEPDWNDPVKTQVGMTFKDGKLIWIIKDRSDLTYNLNTFWEPDTVYPIGAAVLPTLNVCSSYYCEVIEVEYQEINWPTKVGTSILDGRVYWTCIDPEKTAVPLGWDEYYMINYSFTYERFYKK